MRVGDPEDDATEMGPLISAAAARAGRVVRRRRGAFRGEAPDGRGFWFPPTLVEASNDDRVAREEVFGPVAAVIPFADEEEAVRIANDTPYGLSGSIWTRDGARAMRVVRAIETGVLSVNSNTLGARVDAVRRLQAVGLRPRARHARDGRLLGDQERVHRQEA